MSFIMVIDTETTGLDPRVDRIVEVAAVMVDTITRQIAENRWAANVFDPGIPIPPTASAIHHLTDDVVRGAPSCDHVKTIFYQKALTYAAHNAAFDQSFLEWPIAICTTKLAYRLWPDAPAHNNQVLRYWRGIKFNERSQRAIELPPHRALHDAFVTAHLLIELLDQLDWDIEEAKRISSQPALLPTVTFGKHAGLKWANVPTDYLQWVMKQDFDEDVLHTAAYWLDRPF